MKKIKKKERKEDKSCMSSHAFFFSLKTEAEGYGRSYNPDRWNFLPLLPKAGNNNRKEKALILLQTMVKSTFLNKYSHGTTYLHLNNKIQLGFSPYVWHIWNCRKEHVHNIEIIQ